MESKELIKAGRLSEARQQLTAEVKASPGDLSKRTLLFQVLSLCGEWAKAANHLDAIAQQDPAREIGVQVYRNLIQAERERHEAFRMNQRPSFLPQVPPYIEAYFSARQKVNEKKFDEARKLFEKIDAERPAIQGMRQGKPFRGFRDTDTFFSHFLEAIVHDRYVWIPVESIRELSISSPKTLFDLLWIETRITTWEGLSLNCFLPVLYPESCLHEDDRIKLGRMTDWVPLGGSFSKALGQHVFQVGEEERGILDIGEVVFSFPGSREKP